MRQKSNSQLEGRDEGDPQREGSSSLSPFKLSVLPKEAENEDAQVLLALARMLSLLFLSSSVFVKEARGGITDIFFLT